VVRISCNFPLFCHSIDENAINEYENISCDSCDVRLRCHDGRMVLSYVTSLSTDVSPACALFWFSMGHGWGGIFWVRLGFWVGLDWIGLDWIEMDFCILGWSLIDAVNRLGVDMALDLGSGWR